jgi:NAD(P)H-hydrate epimerase
MPLRAKKTWVLDESVFKRIERELDRFQTVALGPGMGEDPATRTLIHMLIERIETPLVLDADGLNALAKDISVLAKRQGETILTPHPKELSRLSGQTVAEIQMDRIAAAQSIAQEHGVTLVLKGVRTIIADAAGSVWINTTGNHGLAKGGSGDILTGLIGGLAAQGLSPLDAAICGVMWHGAAADAVAGDVDPRVMTPDDVIAGLGKGLRQLVD